MSFRLLVAGLLAALAAAVACSSDDGDPPAPDAGADSAYTGTGPASCAPPGGDACCDGDVIGNWTCGASGETVCEGSTRVVPYGECTLPTFQDAASPVDATSDGGG